MDGIRNKNTCGIGILRVFFSAIVAAITLSGSAVLAQSPPPLPAGSSAQAITQPGPPARDMDEISIQSLAANNGLTPEAARNHVALARKLGKVAESLDPDQIPTLAGAYLDSKPDTVLTILYTGDVKTIRSKVLVPADLETHVRFVPSAVPLRELRAQQQRFLRSPGLQGIAAATYVDQRTNRIVIHVQDGKTFEERRRANGITLPPNAQVEIRQLPKELAATQPTTSYTPQPGDFIEGGRWYHEWSQIGSSIVEQRKCTFAFSAKWGTVYGVLTAGHCEPGNYGTGYFYPFGSHWVEMWGPDYESNNQTTKYDFQFHRTPGMKVYNTVAIFNSSDGIDRWLYVWGTHSRLSQPNGYPTCKYGRVTKFACFNVTDNNYYFKNEAGYTTGPWVFVVASSSIAQEGDSGGPVMDMPDGGYVNARGIISRGGFNATKGQYEMIYMPIDHIDDVYPIAILAAPGLQSWGG
jgi:hypothetical protein